MLDIISTMPLWLVVLVGGFDDCTRHTYRVNKLIPKFVDFIKINLMALNDLIKEISKLIELSMSQNIQKLK